jgi:hypothetical protein
MRTLTALLLASAAVAATAADLPATSSVRADAIRGHVEFLAGDLIEGRAAATRGYDIAAAYVAAQFRQAGLAPAGDNETYLQTVPLLEATPVLPGSSAKLVRDDEVHTFEYGTDYLPSADFMSASSTLTAPLVFAGYCVDAPELGYTDFENVDLKGRIAVILSGAPAKFPSSQRAYHSWSERKWSLLVERGAVGAITVASPVDEKRLPWERMVAMSWSPQMRWLDTDGKPQRAFPELKLRFRFNRDAATRLFEDAAASFAEIMAAADAGQPQGFGLPGMLTLSATTGLRRTESANVLGLLPGSDPNLRNEIIVITAHLDHLGRGSAVNGDSIYNGAHDNAVGVAVLLEMARALHVSNTRPRRSVLFAAVTAEEKGLLGSDYFVQAPRNDGRRIVANVNIDMPMPFVRVRDFVALGGEHSSLGTLARNAATAQGYKLSPELAPEEVGFIRSDQFSFIRHGVPALVLNSGYTAREPGVDAATLQRQFRETNYHQPSDDLNLPLDYPTAADLARIDLRILLDAANAASAPRWNAGDFFAEKFGGSR